MIGFTRGLVMSRHAVGPLLMIDCAQVWSAESTTLSSLASQAGLPANVPPAVPSAPVPSPSLISDPMAVISAELTRPSPLQSPAAAGTTMIDTALLVVTWPAASYARAATV